LTNELEWLLTFHLQLLVMCELQWSSVCHLQLLLVCQLLWLFNRAKENILLGKWAWYPSLNPGSKLLGLHEKVVYGA
jgi:hypothetical protein